MSIPRLHGSVLPVAPAAAVSELLVLLPSLGTGSELWAGAAAELRRSCPSLRILRIDLPGHGGSPAAREPFTVGDLATAALRVVDEVGGGSFHLAGVSLGAAVALELALGVPDRVRTLAMFCSGARIGEPAAWRARAEQVRGSGTASLVTGSAGRWFAPGFLETDATGAGARLLGSLLDVNDASYASCCDALAEFDRTPDLARLAVPTLVVSGEHDPVTPPESMRGLADAVPGARYAELEGASHLAVAEQPAVAAALLSELIEQPAGNGEHTTTFARGMTVRREVLGNTHVDAAIAGTTDATAAFQDFLTRYAWGDVWSRPGLSRRDRSIATLAVLVADGHLHELQMHLRAAQRNGLTRDEIAEVLMHVALYAGLPAANAAFGIAKDVFAEPAPDDTRNEGAPNG
ncbi:4-carboxymuconolactone decarboxylase [Lysobacter korlensis]|uniref:4-carboxymuconolactone decarboxylase n=1 Tax=Lysobacter korlensis TaxID=553636 RepID=A0ABV6S046_9GAMM